MVRYSLIRAVVLVYMLCAVFGQEDDAGERASAPSSLSSLVLCQGRIDGLKKGGQGSRRAEGVRQEPHSPTCQSYLDRTLVSVLPRFETRKLEIHFPLRVGRHFAHECCALSPDGSKIVANVAKEDLLSAQHTAFPNHAERVLVVINTRSGEVSLLEKSSLYFFSLDARHQFPVWPLVWSQTSNALVYIRYENRRFRLYKMNLGSMTMFALSASLPAVRDLSNLPNWEPGNTSPEGRWLILEYDPPGVREDRLYITPWSQLSNKRRLGVGRWASWSPDGKWIAHWRPRSWWREWDPPHEIYLPWIMSRSGKDARPLLTEEMLRAHVQPIEATGLRAVSAYPPLAWIAKTGQIVCMGTHVRTDSSHKQSIHWWLFDPQGKRKPQVIETDAVLLAGSRDGKHLLVQVGKDKQTEYYLLDFQD